MNQKLIIEAYKSIEYKGGEKLGSITVLSAWSGSRIEALRASLQTLKDPH